MYPSRLSGSGDSRSGIRRPTITVQRRKPGTVSPGHEGLWRRFPMLIITPPLRGSRRSRAARRRLMRWGVDAGPHRLRRRGYAPLPETATAPWAALVV